MTPTIESITTRKRVRLTIRGVVQGIGFRPFVYRLAHQHELGGWISNTTQGAVLEVEGEASALSSFLSALKSQAPSVAQIQEIESTPIPDEGEQDFTIRLSTQDGLPQSVIPPDLATCEECLHEINDPRSRRYRYPFTTCTRCGPRYSIVLALPYDRVNTTMETFPLCHHCRREYEDMADRRFHAEAMACPMCGPHLALWDSQGAVLAEREDALQRACELVRQGGILAVKGLGGFQLWGDALSLPGVKTLRERKRRPRKPFAVLFPSLQVLRDHCFLTSEDQALLTSPQSPIVLLRRKLHSSLVPLVAPDNLYLGAMLPYTPVHHLLMANLNRPMVATSGNRSEEPIVTDEHEAPSRLEGIADAFLVHNRPIARPVDDSVVRVINRNPVIVRRARGYAPAPIMIRTPEFVGKERPAILAVGGHFKNTIAVATQDQVIMSQHIGDLSTPEAYAQFERTVSDQLRLFNIKPQAIACDGHPDYRSTVFAKKFGKAMNIPVVPVQHHHAHILSCMAEHGLQAPVLGVAWDGTGYGTDGMIWGGEFLLADDSGFTRVGHLQPFRLPGGEICMREPRRVALSLLYEAFGEDCLAMDLPPIRSLGHNLASSLIELLKKNVNCSLTTSMGRLFDGVSSILGLCHFNTFEGEAAMALEFMAESIDMNRVEQQYAFSVEKVGELRIAGWRSIVKAIVEDLGNGMDTAPIAHGFHKGIADLIPEFAINLKQSRLVLSGGVFQNSLLTRLIQAQFQGTNFQVYKPVHIPPNDGGVALGQAMMAGSVVRKGSSCA